MFVLHFDIIEASPVNGGNKMPEWLSRCHLKMYSWQFTVKYRGLWTYRCHIMHTFMSHHIHLARKCVEPARKQILQSSLGDNSIKCKTWRKRRTQQEKETASLSSWVYLTAFGGSKRSTDNTWNVVSHMNPMWIYVAHHDTVQCKKKLENRHEQGEIRASQTARCIECRF